MLSWDLGSQSSDVMSLPVRFSRNHGYNFGLDEPGELGDEDLLGSMSTSPQRDLETAFVLS